jgi:3-hydroxy-9,10-secoandrosta-1,3,5(10)-triene-9,17-dione monooxygenase reductase component
MPQPPAESRAFRHALGAFATGVTIVTTRAPDGTRIGLTANSFNSLSLEPPMVLWALAKSSRSLPAFEAAGHFAVHILAADQLALSDRFATRAAEKFADLESDEGPGGVPLLRGCSARFQCRTAYQYEGGDHVIFVGEVVAFDHSDRPALAYQSGTYASVLRHTAPALPVAEAADDLDGSFSRDFLGYLLGSAHARLMARVRGELDRYRLGEEHYHVLMFLSDEDNRSLMELDALMQLADRRATYQTLVDLAVRDLVELTGPDSPETTARLTAEGHRAAIELGAALKAAEMDAERHLGAREAQTLKALLKGILRAMEPARPALDPEDR